MRKLLHQIITLLLVVLFSYAAFSKWFDFGKFQREMFNQPFAHWLAWLLIFLLPPLELTVALGLLVDKYRRPALMLSGLLLLSFTLYAFIILLGGFGRIPCGCGGFIAGMTWIQHLIFTGTLTFASFWSWYMANSKSYMYNRGS